MIEVGKKASSLKRIIPQPVDSNNSKWQMFEGEIDRLRLVYYSTLLEFDEKSRANGILTVTVGGEGTGVERSAVYPNVTTTNKTETVEKVFNSFVNELTEFEDLCRDDPEHDDTEKHYRQYSKLFEKVLTNLESACTGIAAEVKRKKQLDVSRKNLQYIKKRIQSESFRRALEKPLGYPGDYLLMDMMLKQKINVTGLGYHFDLKFISHSGSEGVRQRTYWVIEQLEKILASKQDNHLTILDMGCGPMTIEKKLAEKCQDDDVSFAFLGLDIDKDAAAYAQSRFKDFPKATVNIQYCNLLSQEGIAQIAANAKGVDACVCMGFFDYLDRSTITAFLEAVYNVIEDKTPIFFANYHPDNPSRSYMEWLLDWWLIYKTEKEMREASIAAGFSADKITTTMDASGSVVLVEAIK